jgi:RimJ/RimL family protein N-acetyltransferase
MPQPSDAAGLFESYTADPRVCHYMVWTPHRSVAETEDFVARCIVAAKEGTRLPYVLVTKERPAEPIGMLEARPSKHTLELGYVLGTAHWGRGYMHEAVQYLAQWALADERFFRVQAPCDVDNRPSQRMLEKAGFLREGRHERFILLPNISAEPRPCYMYALCR